MEKKDGENKKKLREEIFVVYKPIQTKLGSVQILRSGQKKPIKKFQK
jgi:hypothetical protein